MDQNPQDIQPNTEKTADAQIVQVKKRFTKKKVIILLLSILVVAGGAFAFWYIRGHRKKPITSPVTQQSSEAPKVAAITKPLGTTFLDKPKLIEDLKLFSDLHFWGADCSATPNETDYTKCPAAVKASDLAYYQIGQTKDNQRIIILDVTGSGPGGNQYVFTEDTPGKFTLYAVASLYASDLNDTNYKAQVGELKKAVSKNVTVDDSTALSDLSFDPTVTINSFKIKTDAVSGYLMPKGVQSIRGSYFGELKHGLPKLLGEVNGKKIYEVTVDDQSTFSVVETIATIKNVYASQYSQTGEISEQKDKIAYNWTKGEKTVASYYSAGAGCGSAVGYVVAKNINPAELVPVGTTPGGMALYQLPIKNSLVSEIYTHDYGTGDGLEDKSLTNLTAQQFTDKHGYILAKNGLGEYVVYLRADIIMRGGCAKPVVYLYPQTPTRVSVQVGAHITQSNPLYTSKGWQDVLAYPSGNLLYNGQVYDSLYWEGTGFGNYPNITSGSVVPTLEAVKTIISQLHQQGLNDKETNDFVNFWQPNLPQTPFVRISWLSKSAIDRLAPLDIKPRPDSVIRVFIDFEGLDHQVTLPRQNLVKQPRDGFTAVEWGGLARNGLNKLVR